MLLEKRKSFKFVALTMLVTFFLIYRFFLNSEDKSLKESYYCFYDKLLLDYTWINNYAARNLYFRNLLVVFSSASIDILMFNFLIYFVVYGKGCLQIIMTLGLFYVFRGYLQSIFIFTYYHTYLFDDPGFISLVVPYFRAADFFYSGHCGCAMCITLLFRDSGLVHVYYYGCFVTIVQFLVMTFITRAHYSIDAIFGIIAAHYFYIVSGWLVRKIKSWSGKIDFDLEKKEIKGN